MRRQQHFLWLSMAWHGIDVLQTITTHLNPGQIPVMAFDQPLLVLAKFVQWCWPGTYGEEHFNVMFRGLHRNGSLENSWGPT